ncbi:zinc-ribbon domain-containing protein [Gymnodinialimonas ceratoperidinii]|uniref:Zinc-ribbon domain-containing protein n=1 Tax=Gymnodinialimonas ceratoperidinii TaxID=2856823 RepID=A0A8F6TXH2_9RHOB|nr:zinc-ribbon domain-containing protein [Gymnodinialimonas ceratoperidinii]QXT39749.1 zinc-ribbon domain-containing protein [Gymnodinialimonas ceratoperidinii]
MRLTCPNCSARYEVDESMVPPAGRDVQCSNCSTTWFQPGPRVSEPAAAPPPPPAPEASPAPSLSEVAVEGPSGAPGDAAQSDEPRPARRQIDPNVTDILREEAEREARLRRAEAAPAPAPQQEEMPLTAATPPTPSREQRLAELEGAEDAFDTESISAAVASAAAASRREEFPDIEEINSTLRATGDRHEEEASATDVDTIDNSNRRRGSVRRGFFLVIILAAIGVGIYAYAPEIKEAVPQAADVLDQYVEVVNDARLWLDETARALAGWLET